MASIPACVKIAGILRDYGRTPARPEYNVVFGYYKLNGKFLSKIKMRLKNG